MKKNNESLQAFVAGLEIYRSIFSPLGRVDQNVSRTPVPLDEGEISGESEAKVFVFFSEDFCRGNETFSGSIEDDVSNFPKEDPCPRPDLPHSYKLWLLKSNELYSFSSWEELREFLNSQEGGEIRLWLEYGPWADPDIYYNGSETVVQVNSPDELPTSDPAEKFGLTGEWNFYFEHQGVIEQNRWDEVLSQAKTGNWQYPANIAAWFKPDETNPSSFQTFLPLVIR